MEIFGPPLRELMAVMAQVRSVDRTLEERPWLGSDGSIAHGAATRTHAARRLDGDGGGGGGARWPV